MKDKELKMINERINMDIYNCEVQIESIERESEFKKKSTWILLDILKEIKKDPFRSEIRFVLDYTKYNLESYSRVNVLYEVISRLNSMKSLIAWLIDVDPKDSSVISLKRLN